MSRLFFNLSRHTPKRKVVSSQTENPPIPFLQPRPFPIFTVSRVFGCFLLLLNIEENCSEMSENALVFLLTLLFSEFLKNTSDETSASLEHSERKPYSVYSYVYRYSAYIYNLYDILLYDCPYLL